MARVFVSHSGTDAALADEIYRWLIEDGHEAFLDQDLRGGILVGDQWEQRLHERLRWADAVVCLVTSTFVGSVWCTAEVAIAQSRGSRLLPVRAESGVSHPLLNSTQYVDMSRDPVEARAKMAEVLLRVDAAGGLAWPDDRSPFPGLRSLDTDEHQIFFGRSREVDLLAELLRSPAQWAEPAMLLVVGPSGCGKSSLVRAGLVPVMAAEPEWLALPAIRPGAEPIAALARELAVMGQRLGSAWTVTDVHRRLDDGDLGELADDLLLAAPGRRRRNLLLVVDQFEELFTQTGREERVRFVELLRTALTRRVQVVATLRPEFLDQLLASAELSALPARTQALRPLQPEALRAVIEGPADRAGISADEDLVTQLVGDTGGGEALPLLAYTLEQLSKGVERGGRLLSSRYEELGGVRGALVRQSEAALAEAVAASGCNRDQIIRELLRLVTVDEQGRPTRWRIRRDELPDQVITEWQPFVDRRLLLTDAETGHVVVGVAHEQFLFAWPPLRDAITAASSALRARRQVEQAAAEWVENGHAPIRLWERGQLAAALASTGAHLSPRGGGLTATSPEAGSAPELPSPRHWRRWQRPLVADRVELSGRARNFLGASIRRDRRRRGRALTILSALLVVAVFAATVAIVQQHAAADRQRLATARLLLAQADSLLEADPRAALRLHEAAEWLHPDAETRASLVSSLLATPYAGTLTGHTSSVNALAFAPDRPFLATADDEAVRLWDVTNPARYRRIASLPTRGPGPVSAIAFSPDGETMATGHRDGAIVLWDMGNPSNPRLLDQPTTQHRAPVSSIAFGPDGRTLASADGTVVLWDVTDPERPEPIRGALADSGQVANVSFAADRPLLATSADGGDGVLWDVTDPFRPQRFGAAPAGVFGQRYGIVTMALSQDARLLATGGEGLVLLDVTDPVNPRTLPGPPGVSGLITAVAFGGHGSILAASDERGSVLLWDVTDPARPKQLDSPLPAHSDGPTDVTLAADGHTLATAGPTGTVIVWTQVNSAQPRPVGPPLTSPPVLNIYSLGFTSDDRTLGAGASNVALLWDVADPAHPRNLAPWSWGNSEIIGTTTMAMSPRGHLMVTAGNNGAVLWDVTNPAIPRRLSTPLPVPDSSRGAVTAAAFAPDGKFIVLATFDGTALFFDLRQPTRPKPLGTPLRGHNDEVLGMAFSPDGKTLATASRDGTTLLWDVTEPQHARRIGTSLTSTLSVVAFSPDGQTLVTADRAAGTDTQLWDVSDRAHPRRIGSRFTEQAGPARAAIFSPDGHTLVTAGKDTRLWDVSDPGNPRRIGDPLTGQTGPIFAVAFTVDGATLATATDTTVVLWDFRELNDLNNRAPQHACSVTGGGLDRSEWAQYVPSLDYIDTCRD